MSLGCSCDFARRIGALIASTAAHAKRREAARRSATQHSVDLRFEEVNQPEEIEPAISRLTKQGVQALIVFSNPWIGVERPRILKLALAQSWPVVG